MIEKFKDEYYWMLRQSKGYFPWIQNNIVRHPWLYEIGPHNGNFPLYNDGHNSRGQIKLIIEGKPFENQLFDLFFKSILRAEIRLISRFIPQGSHEERLTGSLVSEIDNSIFIIKDNFREISKSIYGAEKQIDFFYYDLSQGGKIEKQTGADLGFILAIDLPDYPFTVKSLILQAKKIKESSQIDISQYEVICENGDNDSAYLFYDMDLKTACCPIVLPVNSPIIKNKYEENANKKMSSFSIKQKELFSYGWPLSLFIISHLLTPNTGREHSSFKDAFNFFKNLSHGEAPNKNKQSLSLNGRLAIVSIGKSINYSANNDEGIEIEI